MVQGLLESLDDKVDVEALQVEITIDGGKSWSRTKGGDEWEWSFAPRLEEIYEFSLRIVKDESQTDYIADSNGGNDGYNNGLNNGEFPDLLRIADFYLKPDFDASFTGDLLSGSGLLEIPFLANFNRPTEIEVNFRNVRISGNRIITGEVVYEDVLELHNSLVDIVLSRLVISANHANNSLAGSVQFKDAFRFLPTLPIAPTSRLLPNEVHVELPVTAQSLDIWEEKNVQLVMDNGTIIIDYALRDDQPRISTDGLNARVEFGELLRAGEAVVAEARLFANRAEQIVLYFTNEVKAYFLDSDLAIEGINATLDLNKGEIYIVSSLNCEDYADIFLQTLTGSRLEAVISEDGFDGTIQADGGLAPLVLLDRGGSGKDVELRVLGTPEIRVVVDKNGLDFDYGQLAAEISFGDLLQGGKNPHGGAIEPLIATFNNSSNGARQYSLRFARRAKGYLLGTDFNLENLSASLNIANKTITLESKVDLSTNSNPFVRGIKNATLIAEISPSGFQGRVRPSAVPDPLVVLDLGTPEKSVSLEFESLPIINLAVINNGIDFDLGRGLDGVILHFGDLFDGATATLGDMVDDLERIYPWRIAGQKTLSVGSKVTVSDIHGVLDLTDLENPWSSFNAIADFSDSGEGLAGITGARIDDGLIAKTGLCARVQVDIEDIDVWQQHAVKVHFTEAPVVNVSVTRAGFGMGLTNLHAELYFGDLLENAVATLNSTSPYADRYGSCASAGVNGAGVMPAEYVWFIPGRKRLLDTDVYFSGLSGSINLTNFADPAITLNAIADLRGYGDVFKNVARAGLEDATISRAGFDGIVSLGLSDIDIWKDKNIKIVFSDYEMSRFRLALTASGLTFAPLELNGEIDFGDLFADVRSRLQMTGEGIYGWNLRGRHLAIDTELIFENLFGTLDLGNLNAPVLNLEGGVDLSNYSTSFKTVKSARLANGLISMSGFSGDIGIELDGIDIWQDKRVQLDFNGQAPTLSLSIDREGIDLGFWDLAANLDFGDLMDGEVVRITSVTEGQNGSSGSNSGGFERWNRPNTPDLPRGPSLPSFNKPGKPDGIELPPIPPCVYNWELQNRHNLIVDEDGTVIVTRAAGTIDACDVENPIITFNAAADFSAYHLGDVQFHDVDLEEATISKTGIDFKLNFTGAEAEFVILDLGGPERDVWVELFNVDGHANNDDAGIEQADGILYFGELFDGNIDPVDMTYRDTGLYTFSTDQVFTYSYEGSSITISGLSGEVQQQGDSYKVTLVGDSLVRTPWLAGIGLENLDIERLEINDRGLVGVVKATLRAEDKVFNIINNQVRLILNVVEVQIDSSAEQPIALTELDGSLDLSPIFDENGEDAYADLHFENGRVNWNFDQPLHLYENFIFDRLNGFFTFDQHNVLGLSLGGHFGYQGIDSLDIELRGFTIDTTGLNGSVDLDYVIPVPGIAGLNLTGLSATFGRQISGELRLAYNNDSFLDSGERLYLELAAFIDSSGISEFTIDANALRNIVIPDFATMSFSDVSVSPSLEDFEIVLDGTIKPANSLFKADYAMEFSGLKISSSGIGIDGLGGEFPISGSSGELGGLELSLESLGIGFESNKFYVSAKGSLSLLVTEAGAGLKLFSNGDLEVDSIKVVVNNPALTFGGEISWYDNDAVYGNGFGAEGLQLKLANMFSIGGAFKIGDKRGKGFYWMAKAQAGLGSGIPMGPITVYELGGGAAYNMSYFDDNPNDSVSGEFIPSGDENVVIIISSLLGTPDLGFTWHGQVDINIDSAGQIVIEGKTYILCPKNDAPIDKEISGTIVLGFTPASLHISARTSSGGLNFMDVIGMKGGVDIMLSGSEKHVFLGTDARAEGFNVSHDLGNIEVSTFGLKSFGYFMLDTRRLAFGTGYDFDETISLDVWGPDPYLRLQAYARADALMQYNPFFMDLSAEAGVSLTAGYAGIDYTLGAWLELRLRAPSPTYMKVRAGVDIPVYGDASFTTYFPGRPRGGGGDNLPTLINHIEPYVHDGISLMPKLKVVSTFNSDGSHFNVGDMEPRVAIEYNDSEGVYSEPQYFTSNVLNVRLIDTETNRSVRLRSVRLSNNEIEYIPENSLTPGHTYRFTGLAKLVKTSRTVTTDFSDDVIARPTGAHQFGGAVDPGSSHSQEQHQAMWFRADPETYLETHDAEVSSETVLIKEETFTEEFTVRDERRLEFSEIVTSVYPENLQKDVGEIEPIVITYDEIVETLGPRNSLIRNYGVEVVDSEQKKIEGTFRYDTAGGPKTIFQPVTALRIYHYCLDKTTGVARETFLNPNDQYLNPFNGFTVDGAEGGNGGNNPGNVNIPSGVNANPLRQGIDMGSLVYTVGNYEYYTNADYSIIVTDLAAEQIVYVSTFTVKHNFVPTEEVRRTTAMGDQLEPKLIYSIYMGERNLGENGRVRLVVDSNLETIGVRNSPAPDEYAREVQGVGCQVEVTWRMQQGVGQFNNVRSTFDWGDQYHNFDLPEGELLGIVGAKVVYYNTQVPRHRSLLLEKAMILEEGPPYFDHSGVEESANADRIAIDVIASPEDRFNVRGREGGMQGRGTDVGRGNQAEAVSGVQFQLGM